MLALDLSPQHLLEAFGLLGVAAVVFAESGLLVGFFLPGDSLLFAAGAAAGGALATVSISFGIWTLVPVVIVAAIAGDQLGFTIGRRVGRAIHDRPDSLLFKQAHLRRAEEFFDRYGPKALVLARFVPIVRTFVPVLAGAAVMDRRVFTRFNIVGGALWGASIPLLGFWFGHLEFVQAHLEITILAVVLVSLVPTVVELARSRWRSGSGSRE